MARRRKLNKWVVILLSVIGVFLGLLVVAGVILARPRNPQALVQEAEALLKRKEYAEAIKLYQRAASESHNPDHLLGCANAMLERLTNDRRLSEAERRGLFQGAHSRLMTAVQLRPDFLDAQRRLTGLEYTIAAGSGDWMRYIRSLDRLIELDPKSHEAFYQRARAKAVVAVSNPDYVGPAAKDFNTAVELAPETERYYVTLAAFLTRQGRKKEVEDTYLKGIEANSSTVMLRVALAEFYQREGRKDDALKQLKKGVEVQPDKAEGYLALASYHQREKDLGQAVAALEKAAQVEPGDYRAFSRLATLRTFERKPAEAEAALRQGLEAVAKAVGEDPSKLQGQELLRYRSAVLTLNHQLCDILLERLRGGGSKREDILPKVNDALSKMRGIQENSPYVTKIEGWLAMINGEPIEAERLLRKAYDAFRPGFEAKTAELLINLYRQLRQLGEAERIIRDYLAISPESAPARMELAQLQIDYRNYNRASSFVEAVLRTNPENEQALATKALLEVLSGKTQRIPDTLKELNRDQVTALMIHAQQLWVEGRRVQALQLATDVVNRQPRDLRPLVQLIRWYQAQNEMDKVQALYDHAQRVFQDDPTTLWQLNVLREPNAEKRLAYRLQDIARQTNPFLREIQTAEAYRGFGEEEQYLQHLKAAEAIDPNKYAVVEPLFQYALSKRDWAMAQQYAQTAAKLDLDEVGGRLYDAQVAWAKGEHDEAIRLTTEALRQRPRFSQGHSFLGNCYLAVNRLDLAKASFETAYGQNPANLQALLGLVKVAEAEGKTDEYARWVEEAYKFAPGDPGVEERYLQLLEERDQPEDVIKRREDRRKTQPTNVVNLVRLGALYEGVGQPARAREVYLALYEVTGGSIQSVRLLTDLLGRMDEDVRAQSILAEYAEAATDKLAAYLLWADYCERAGDHGRARVLLAKAIEAGPDDARGYLAAARFEAAQGNWAQAVEHQRKAMERAGKQAPARLENVLASFLIEAGQFKEAQGFIDAALVKEPDDKEWMTLQSRVYFGRREYDKARETLDRILTKDTTDTAALIYRAQVHLAKGDVRLAMADLEMVRRTNPSVAVLQQLARLYERIGDFENAYRVLQSLLAERPGYAPAMQQLVDLCWNNKRWTQLQQVLPEARKLYPREVSYVRREADMWYELNQPGRAIPMLLEARKLLPGSAAAGVLLMRALIQGGRYDEALTMGAELQAHGEFGPSARALNGHAYLKKNDAANAEKEFAAALTASTETQLSFVYQQLIDAYKPDAKRAADKLTQWLPLRPKDWQIRLLLSRTLSLLEDYNGAEKYLEEGLAFVKDDLEKFQVLRQLGLVYYQLGKYEKSRTAYVAALGIAPMELLLLNNLAWLLVADLKKPDEALPYAERALQVSPYSPHTLDTYGVILKELGRHPEAEENLRRSIDFQEMPANRLHLGELYEKMNRKSDALREFRAGWRLVEKAPKDLAYQPLRDALKRLGD